MLKYLFSFLFICCFGTVKSQDSSSRGTVTYTKDPRIDDLGKKMGEFNDAIASSIAHSAKGFRLMLLSTSDRNAALALRTRLLQLFPDQKVYMTYQFPYIKLKFGNFVEKPDAERFRDLLAKTNIVATNVYVVPDIVEVRPDKLKVKEEDQ